MQCLHNIQYSIMPRKENRSCWTYKMGGRDLLKATLFIIYIVSVEGWPVHNDYLGGKQK